MNVIEYISNQENYLSLFEDTFDVPIQSYHLDNSKWEAQTFFYPFKKDFFESKEEVLMISLIQEFVRFGDYYFSDVPKTEILKKVTSHLNAHYGDSQFDLTTELSLRSCVERHTDLEFTRLYKNEDRHQVIEKREFFSLNWTKEETVKAYHLMSEWNNEDYLFETENYFIRFNWNTSA